MKLIISIFLLLSFNFIIAQQDTKFFSAGCRPDWKKGEKKVLLITRSNIGYSNGKLSSRSLINLKIDISVIDSSDEGYTMEWVFHFTEKFKQDNPTYEVQMPGYDGLRMLFKIGENGAFKELVNWKEVKDVYVEMFESSLPKDMDKETRAAIDKSNSLFNSKEMVEATLIKELKIYHSPYGGVFYTDEMSFQTSFPSPFGGEPFPATATQKISSFNLKEGTYKVVITQKIDSLDATGMLKDMLNKLNLKDDSLVDAAKKQLLDYKTTDYSEFTVKQSSGWITKLNFTRTVIGSGKKDVEYFEMVLK